MLLLIDNYDSFTYNLAQMLEQLNIEIKVYRNDEIDIQGIEGLRPSALMVSPGPGTPDNSGISIEAINNLGAKIPILGVCLGHQAIAAVYGAKVVGADRIMHGKTSMIFHDGRSIYRDLSNPFEAVRYHSLIVRKDSLPDCLEMSAWTEDGEIMGLRHREYRVEGVQFHPESILTESGPHLLRNFLIQGGAYHD
jgi:anthranilate synthase/aminodeoxychorismate synthase-like glutamine amidotransferase